MQSSAHRQDIGSFGTGAEESVLKLLVQGFTPAERQLLDAIVQLSQRRQPRIELLHAADGESADVVMIDAADTLARKWAANQRWLAHKPVIWVDAPGEPGPTELYRPVHWSALPILLARALEKTPSNAVNAVSAKPQGNAVLVVDDSAAVRAQLRALLESRGLAVADVDSAEAALAAAAASHYACILMDVLMPGIDGYEACRRIKASKHGAPAIVMLTSKSSPFDRIRGKMAGCDAYLTKPVDAEHLYEVISRHMETPASNGAAPHGMAPPQFA
jgi:two-component system cell cycle response regulator